MSDTNFIDKSTVILPAWLNDVNALRYGANNSARGAALLQYANTTATGYTFRDMQSKASDILSAFDLMSSAQIADVKARTRLLDVSVPMQAFFNAGGGLMPVGDYLCNTPLIARASMAVCGHGGASTRLVTTANINQIINDPLTTYGVTFSSLQVRSEFPISVVAGPTPTGTVTNGSANITAVSSVAGLQKGMLITGTGIPVSTYIRKISGSTVTMGNLAGSANVLATSNGTAFASFYRQGPTNFQAYIKDGGRWIWDDVWFKTAFTDIDYSPSNAAGLWHDRTSGAQYFVNTVRHCWFDHAQLLMGTSDSDIVDTIIWANPFDYSLKLAAPNIRVVGGSVSAGVLQGIWAASTIAEPNGASVHLIKGVNIDGGDIWYTGYGVRLDQSISVSIDAMINGCYKGGVIATDTTGVEIDIICLNNNREDNSYSDVENVSLLFQPTGMKVTGTFVRTVAHSNPGYAVKETNGGGGTPAGCVYSSGTISTNYATGGLSIAAAVASGQYPKISNWAGGGAETESLPNPVTNSFTGTLTGCTTSPTAAVTWTRQGNLITLNIPNLLATSNTTSCTITGMPAALWPTTQQNTPFLIEDNTATAIGYVVVSAAGVLTLNKASGNFTNVGTKGSIGGIFTYALAG